ncbi:hypothetical protein M5K25_024423 [Dendrobium thyrsiflorum]|uniref:Uncharacterized protein n=1 Tax=Dendrobium thyrsiflorum TaxID=117978 RepID=A0ABD0U271_DENTH
MASSNKKSKVSKGSSRNENFLSKDNETAYGSFFASKITPSRILIQSDINFQILPLFSSTQLSFILTLSHSYHKEIFLQFLSNLRVTPECTRLSSFVMQQKVTIDKEDLGNFLHLRTEGDRLHTLIQEADISWSLVNDTLRGNKDKVHQPRVYTLLQNARIIQHVLRSSIIPKAGDRVNITPLLSLVTHLIMTNTPFDEAQLILDYIHSLSDIRHPQTKRKKNIALGHLVCYILEKKYNLIYPEPPTEEPIFFTNASFRSLFHDPSVEGEDSEGDKEAPSEPAPVPNQNAFHDIIQRFDTMETNFDQRFDQIDLHMKTQEDRHNLDMAWIRGQTDYINQNVAMINSYFTAFNPQPPSDQDPGALQSVLAEVLCLHRGVVKKEEGVLCLHRGEVKKGSVAVLCHHRGEVKKGRVAVLCRRKEEGFSAITVERELPSSPEIHLITFYAFFITSILASLAILAAICASCHRKPKKTRPLGEVTASLGPTSKTDTMVAPAASSIEVDDRQPDEEEEKITELDGKIHYPTHASAEMSKSRRRLSMSSSMALQVRLSRIRTGRSAKKKDEEEILWMKTIIMGERNKVPPWEEEEEEGLEKYVGGSCRRNYRPRSLPVSPLRWAAGDEVPPTTEV